MRFSRHWRRGLFEPIRNTSRPPLCADHLILLSDLAVRSCLPLVPFAFALHHATYLAGLLVGLARGLGSTVTAR
jgi:hypothetical protein